MTRTKKLTGLNETTRGNREKTVGRMQNSSCQEDKEKKNRERKRERETTGIIRKSRFYRAGGAMDKERDVGKRERTKRKARPWVVAERDVRRGGNRTGA